MPYSDFKFSKTFVRYSGDELHTWSYSHWIKKIEYRATWVPWIACKKAIFLWHISLFFISTLWWINFYCLKSVWVQYLPQYASSIRMLISLQVLHCKYAHIYALDSGQCSENLCRMIMYLTYSLVCFYFLWIIWEGITIQEFIHSYVEHWRMSCITPPFQIELNYDLCTSKFTVNNLEVDIILHMDWLAGDWEKKSTILSHLIEQLLRTLIHRMRRAVCKKPM